MQTQNVIERSSRKEICFSVRMTESQMSKLIELGGASWIREKIDATSRPLEPITKYQVLKRRNRKAICFSVRMTQEQQSKLILLGGASWVRDKIDGAKIKTTTSSRYVAGNA